MFKEVADIKTSDQLHLPVPEATFETPLRQIFQSAGTHEYVQGGSRHQNERPAPSSGAGGNVRDGGGKALRTPIADIKTSDQLHLPVPEATFETVVAKPSELQKEMVQNLSERAARVHSGIVDASEDNMLCITNDGRKIGLDVRLMNPMLPDDPSSKLNACVRNVLQIWEEGKD